MRNRIVKSGVIAVTRFVVAAAALPAHDQVVPFEQHATVRELLGAEWLPVPEAGHIPQVERPELVNPRILEFLRRWHPTEDQLEPSELR